LNKVRVKRLNQLASFFHPSINLKVVSCISAGNAMNVRTKANANVGSKPYVFMKFFLAFFKKLPQLGRGFLLSGC